MAFSELIIILLISVILIKPEDIPKILLYCKRLMNKIFDIKKDITNVIETMSHNQEILELEKLIKNNQPLGQKDIEKLYRLINERVDSNSKPDIIDENDKKHTIH